MVVVSTPLALLSGEEERQFCHQHIKNAFKDVKFPSRKNPGVKVTYDGEYNSSRRDWDALREY